MAQARMAEGLPPALPSHLPYGLGSSHTQAGHAALAAYHQATSPITAESARDAHKVLVARRKRALARWRRQIFRSL